MQKSKEIFPVFEKIISKEEKEKLLGQNAKVVWLTGLSGSGKTTLGAALERKLFEKGFLTQVLDGDNIRSGINSNLGFSEADRYENIRRIAEVTKLFINCGVIPINCFITPTEEIRNIAREIIGRENIFEIFVSTPIEVCEDRDTKGLYKKARAGELKNFTGISSPFETPVDCDMEIDTSKFELNEAVNKILDKLMKNINKEISFDF